MCMSYISIILIIIKTDEVQYMHDNVLVSKLLTKGILYYDCDEVICTTYKYRSIGLNISMSIITQQSHNSL